MLRFEEIAESVVDAEVFDIILARSDFDRRFWCIDIRSKRYLLGWQSDSIEPKVCLVEKANFVAIGIDLNFFLINLTQNEVVLRETLNSFFLTFYAVDDLLIAATQLDVYLIEVFTLKAKTKALPDTFENLVIENGHVTVKCMDGSTRHIPLKENSDL